MQKIETSGLAGALRRVAAMLVLGAGALLFAAPAQAGWHGGWGGGWGGGWHGGGWRGGWCCGGWGWGPSISLGFWGSPGYYGYPYYGYPYYGSPYAYAPPAAPAYYPPAAPSYYPPQPQAATQAPAQTQSWYYCNNPKGYYPYVQSCGAGWRAVPATPQGVEPTQ